MSAERIVTWDPTCGDELHLGPAVVSIGVFDGLHLGHRALLAQARAEAERLGTRLAVVTFAADPDELFSPAPFEKLLSNERRLGALAALTDDVVVALPATSAVFSLDPQAFLDLLGRACDPQAFFIGADFRFGAHAAGTVDDIASWCAARGCACHPVGLLEEEGAPVTATRIRALLERGDVAGARRLLGGRAHSVEGTVVHGRGEGAGFGFATANLSIAAGQPMFPREGVYGGYARVEDGKYAAAINVGVAKSFAAATSPLEVHLLDFEGDLYGKRVEVSFTDWLRAPRVFETREELIETVTDNINWVRENLGGDALGSN